jgi:hypothetical protein
LSNFDFLTIAPFSLGHSKAEHHVFDFIEKSHKKVSFFDFEIPTSMKTMSAFDRQNE